VTDEPVKRYRIDPDGTIWGPPDAGRLRDQLKVVEVATGRELGSLPLESFPGGVWFLRGGVVQLLFTDFRNGQLSLRLWEPESSEFIVCLGDKGRLELWAMATKELFLGIERLGPMKEKFLKLRLPGCEVEEFGAGGLEVPGLQAMAVSPDGREFAYITAMQDWIQIRRVADGGLVGRIRLKKRLTMKELWYGRGGKTLVAIAAGPRPLRDGYIDFDRRSPHYALVYERETGRLLREFPVLGGNGMAAAVEAGLVAAGTWERREEWWGLVERLRVQAALYDLETGEELGRIDHGWTGWSWDNPLKRGQSLMLTPDGGYLITSTYNGTKVWAIERVRAKAEGEERLRR